MASNLNAKHAARKAFIESESSEKLRRAVRHLVRTSIVESYNNGDMVLFKRNKCERWLGPGTVIGWENKQVLVKHGGSYVRVHPSRLRLYHSNEEKCLNGNQEQNINNPILPQQRRVIPELRDIKMVDNFDFFLSNILDFMFFSYYLDLKVSKYKISQ